MEKRAFRTYLNNNNRDYLKVNCFEYENGYLITDTYSIIKLNQTNDLQVEKDIMGVAKIFRDFDDNFKKLSDLDLNYDLKEQELQFEEWLKEDREYAINIKIVKRINKIINFDKVELLYKYHNGYNYIIKLENTKTQEIAFLLPMRSF